MIDIVNGYSLTIFRLIVTLEAQPNSYYVYVNYSLSL